MPATDYLTLAEVKDQLIDKGTEDDPWIGRLITRASRKIDGLTGRFFYISSAVTRLFDGSGQRSIVVPDLVSVSLLRVKIGGTAGAFTTIPSTQFFLQPADRRPDRPATALELSDMSTAAWHFDPGFRTVEVTGDWGWAAIPDDIKEVCMEMVVRSFRNRASGDSDAPGLDLEPSNIPRGLSRSSMEILENYGYRAMRFA